MKFRNYQLEDARFSEFRSTFNQFHEKITLMNLKINQNYQILLRLAPIFRQNDDFFRYSNYSSIWVKVF